MEPKEPKEMIVNNSNTKVPQSEVNIITKPNKPQKRHYPKRNNRLIHYNANRKTHIIISPNKDKYIFVLNKSKRFVVMANFKLNNGTALPSFKVPINRIGHTQNLLKVLPNGVILRSNGKEISIDIISKLITVQQDSTSNGYIQYQLADKNDLSKTVVIAVYQELKEQVSQYMVYERYPSDYVEVQPDALNISSIMLDQGSIICVTDAIEKILKIPIKNPKTGFVGCIQSQDLKLFNIYRKIWPELQLRSEMIDGKFHIFSKTFKYELIPEFQTGSWYLNIHKNYGGTDIELTFTHELIDTFDDSVVNYQMYCEK